MLLVLSSAAAAALDLTNIERRIAREPAYRSKPRYCRRFCGDGHERRLFDEHRRLSAPPWQQCTSIAFGTGVGENAMGSYGQI
jgi:hypothetical protein